MLMKVYRRIRSWKITDDVEYYNGRKFQKKISFLMKNMNSPEYITMIGSKPVHWLSDDAYKQMIKGNGKSYNEKAKTIINCESICNMDIQEKSKKKHQFSNKFIEWQEINHNKMICQKNIVWLPAILPINEEV